MKRLLLLVIALLIGLPLAAQTRSRYLVKMRRPPAMTNLSIVRDAAESTERAVRTFRNFDLVGVDLTEAEAQSLRMSPEVGYVSKVVDRHIELDGFQPAKAKRSLVPAPAVSRFAKAQTIPYGIDLVRTREVWPATRGGNAMINVAVIDTGIDYTHPDLKGRFVGGYNVFTKTEDPMDDHGHGTHVSGTIAAVDNNFGVVGVAPEVRLWGVKVLQASGSGTDETVIAGLDWVIAKKKQIGGNWIMSLSLGAEQTTDPERLAFGRAIDEGILVVAAAGNRGIAILDYPASYQGVLAISAIDKDSKIAGFSSFGSGVAFTGPGVNVYSTVPPALGFEAKDIELADGRVFEAAAMEGTPLGEVTTDTIVCGEGHPQDFPANTAGKIALIRRSAVGANFRFRDKVLNAMNAGAAAVIMMANDDRLDLNWTVLATEPDKSVKWPVVLSVLKADGDLIAAKAGQRLTLSYRVEEYTAFNGTSMATPHVSGAAALAWSLAPNATASQIALAMKLTADDLGKPGYDDQFGYGRVNAIAVAQYLAPAIFNVPPPPPLDPKRKRQGH